MDTRQHRRRTAHRQWRSRWLSRLSVVALLLIAGLVGAVQARAWRRHLAAQALLQQAAERESEQQWIAAADYVDAYVNLCPDDASQRVKLAQLYVRGVEDAPQREQAIHLLYRALGVCQDNERLPLRSDLALLLLTAERFSEAEAEAILILKVRPHDAAALRVRALALHEQYRLGALDYRVSRSLPVIEWLEEARRAHPDDIKLAELTAAAYRNSALGAPGHPNVAQREQLADSCLDDLVQARPQDPLAYLARHRYRIRFDLGDADADLKLAIKYGPHHRESLLAGAEAAMRKGGLFRDDRDGSNGREDFAKAAELFRKVIDSDKPATDPEPYLGLGDSLFAIDELAKAKDVWLSGLQKFPNHKALFQGKLADVHLAAHETKQAEAYLDAVDQELNRHEAPDRDQLTMQRDQSLRRGVWLMQRGSARPALVELQRVITLQEQLGGRSRQELQAWKQLGDAYASLEQWPQSAAAFDSACFENPQAGELWVQASQSHLQAAHFDLAVDRARQAVRQAPNCLTHLTLARALFQLQLSLPAGEAHWRPVGRQLEAAQQRHGDGSVPDDKPLKSLARALAAAQADTSDTRSSGLSLHQLHHREWPTMHAVHELFAVPGKKSMEPQVARSVQEMPFEGVLMLSRVQALRGEYELAEEMLEHSAAGRPAAEQSYLYQEIVHHRLARGDVKEAHALLSTLVNESPNNPALLELAAKVDIENTHRVEAERAESILR